MIYSPWNSESWSWIKFVDNVGSEWIGTFRGEAVDVALSSKHQIVLVLTSDYLFQLDINTRELVKYDDHRSYYQGLTVSPLQDFILCDYSAIYKMERNIDEKVELRIPMSISLVDYMKLQKWEGNVLKLTCEEPTSEYCYLCEMEYDCVMDSITLSKKSIL